MCVWWRNHCHLFIYNKFIPSNRKWRHMAVFHWYCRLAKLRYTGHVARMGKNCIPNLILTVEIKERCCKQGKPKKKFREGLKNNLHLYVWEIHLWEKYDQQASTNISEKLGKNKVKKSNTWKEKIYIFNYIYIYIYTHMHTHICIYTHTCMRVCVA